MPSFLTTSGTAHIIEDIIIRAKSELVLITPYLKLSRILSERLTEANQRGVNITLVYGKSELHSEERRRLDALPHLTLLYLENLHAKCYYNENQLIISSMNLYEFSEKNNREMGIALTRRDDEECFADALAEAQSIMAAARASTTAQRPFSSSASSSQTIQPNPQKEFDHALKVRKVYELLQKNAPSQQFTIETHPHSYGGGFSTVVFAQDFPRKGIRFQFDGSIRLDFNSSREYQHLKESKRNQVDRELTGFKCYWNRDVIQIYVASNYEFTDEQTVAEYFIQAFYKTTDILFRL